MNDKPDLTGAARRSFHAHRGVIIFLIVVIGLIAALASYAAIPRIPYNISIDSVAVGGLTRQQAHTILAEHFKSKKISGITLRIGSDNYPIDGSSINLSYDIDGAIEQAWAIGHGGNPFTRIITSAGTLLIPRTIPIHYAYDTDDLRNEVATIATIVDQPGRDIRVRATGDRLELLTDSAPGKIVDQTLAAHVIIAALAKGQNTTESIPLTTTEPTIALDRAQRSYDQTRRAISDPVELHYANRTFAVAPTQLASWVTSAAQGPDLVLDFDHAAIANYVTTVAAELDAEPQASSVTVEGGKVTDFTAPQIGQRLDQTKAVTDIVSLLRARQDHADATTEIALAVATVKPNGANESAAELGITELIGTASTRLTGSPKNRISNIKNGVKFLTGIIVKPGEEFSTLTTLGTIDNSTGYLPELVIKEDRTTPEYGGGLCQVSTTLFRAVMNTGLPVTARQNHSYRVPYYEKDGDGKYIGPGLDATIYSPAPDFRFLNDTTSSILIQGHVEGDKITFDMYGTKDTRIAAIEGPKKLTDTPAGDPIYVETDTLQPGEKKQLEKAHNGGSAIATYTVTYPDGTVKEQVFKSFYRNWPARWLIGVDPANPNAHIGVPTTTPPTI